MTDFGFYTAFLQQQTISDSAHEASSISLTVKFLMNEYLLYARNSRLCPSVLFDLYLQCRRQRLARGGSTEGLTGATSSDVGFANGLCVEPGEAKGCDWASANGERGRDQIDETLEPDLLRRCQAFRFAVATFFGCSSKRALFGRPGLSSCTERQPMRTPSNLQEQVSA